MYVSKMVMSALMAGMVSVLGAAAMAYTDVQVLKKEVENYQEDIHEINENIRGINASLLKLASSSKE